jgi:hypothetical protein
MRWSADLGGLIDKCGIDREAEYREPRRSPNTSPHEAGEIDHRDARENG